MFKVQRFTAEDEEEGGGRDDDSNSILNKVLARAKARASAKRAQLPPSSDGVQYQAVNGAPPLEGKSGTKFALNSAADGLEGGAAASKGGQSSPTADSAKDRAGGAVQEEGRGTSEDDGDSGGEEASSSSESSSEGDESGDSGEEEKDAEILPTAEPGASPVEGGGGEEQEADGHGLRPMEEVAEEWGLDSRLAETLREEGVKHFFPIQVSNSSNSRFTNSSGLHPPESCVICSLPLDTIFDDCFLRYIYDFDGLHAHHALGLSCGCETWSHVTRTTLQVERTPLVLILAPSPIKMFCSVLGAVWTDPRGPGYRGDGTALARAEQGHLRLCPHRQWENLGVCSRSVAGELYKYSREACY